MSDWKDERGDGRWESQYLRYRCPPPPVPLAQRIVGPQRPETETRLSTETLISSTPPFPSFLSLTPIRGAGNWGIEVSDEDTPVSPSWFLSKERDFSSSPFRKPGHRDDGSLERDREVSRRHHRVDKVETGIRFSVS